MLQLNRKSSLIKFIVIMLFTPIVLTGCATVKVAEHSAKGNFISDKLIQKNTKIKNYLIAESTINKNLINITMYDMYEYGDLFENKYVKLSVVDQKKCTTQGMTSLKNNPLWGVLYLIDPIIWIILPLEDKNICDPIETVTTPVGELTENEYRNSYQDKKPFPGPGVIDLSVNGNNKQVPYNKDGKVTVDILSYPELINNKSDVNINIKNKVLTTQLFPISWDVVSAVFLEKVLEINTIEELDRFLKTPAGAKHIDTLLHTLAQSISKQNDALKTYDKYLDIYPDIFQHIPESYRLKMTGPKGMRIYQLLELTDAGMSPDIVASKIILSESRYINFSFEELTALNKLGFPDKVVTAMIQSTKDSNDKERRTLDARRKKEDDRKKIDEDRDFYKSQLNKLK